MRVRSKAGIRLRYVKLKMYDDGITLVISQASTLHTHNGVWLGIEYTKVVYEIYQRRIESIGGSSGFYIVERSGSGCEVESIVCNAAVASAD